MRRMVTAGGSAAAPGHRAKWPLEEMEAAQSGESRGWGSDKAGELGAPWQETL